MIKTASGNVAYLRIVDFTLAAKARLYDAIRDLDSQGYKAMILDLRNNPGGLLDQAVDPTGAGDTVAAAVTLGLAAGADLRLAASVATVAAGIAVSHRGTVAVSRDEVAQTLRDWK